MALINVSFWERGTLRSSCSPKTRHSGRGEYSGAIVEAVARLALNIDSAFGTHYKGEVRVVAGIACSVGRNCRARARSPCTVEML